MCARGDVDCIIKHNNDDDGAKPSEPMAYV